MSSFLFLLVAISAYAEKSINYTWPQYNDNYDSMVGVAINNTPICTGVLIHPKYVITSANPLEEYYDFGSNLAKTVQVTNLKIYVVDGTHDKSKGIPFPFVTGNQGGRRNVWVKTGVNSKHSPVHDIVLIATPDNVVFNHCRTILGSNRQPCHEFFLRYEYKTYYTIINEPNASPVIAGFGFVDEKHIKDNDSLEIVDFEGENVWENCDEWIPREWGYFICLRNIYNFVGISSGAGLFYGKELIGLGSFSLEKGNESILVFTNLTMIDYGYRTYGFHNESY